MVNFKHHNLIVKIKKGDDFNMAGFAEEHLISVNEYQEPKVLKDHDAVYTLIVRLILLDPGKDKDRPDKGVGLISNYRYSFTEKLEELRTRIRDQIMTYLPDFISVDVSLKAFGTSLAIYVETDNITYGMKFNSDTGELLPLTLDDIK